MKYKFNWISLFRKVKTNFLVSGVCVVKSLEPPTYEVCAIRRFREKYSVIWCTCVGGKVCKQSGWR